MLALALLGAAVLTPAQPCTLELPHATLVGVRVGATEVDVRGQDATITLTAEPGVALVQTAGPVELSGVVHHLALRPRAGVRALSGALEFGSDARIVGVTRGSGRTVRGDVRVSHQLVVHDVRLECADLVADVRRRQPTRLTRATRVHEDRAWRVRARTFRMTTADGTDRRVSVVGAAPHAVFVEVLGRGPHRARVELDWGEGTLRGTVPREHLALSSFGSVVFSGGKLHSLSGEHCVQRPIGRRGGPHVYTGPAVLKPGARLRDADGVAWATIHTPVEVEIDWDRREPRARLVRIPGVPAPRSCDRAPEAFVEASELTLEPLQQ